MVKFTDFQDLKSDYNAMKAQVGRIPTMADFVEEMGATHTVSLTVKSLFMRLAADEGDEKVPEIDARLEKVLEFSLGMYLT